MTNVIDLQARRLDRYMDLAIEFLALAHVALDDGVPYAAVIGSLSFARDKLMAEAVAARRPTPEDTPI